MDSPPEIIHRYGSFSFAHEDEDPYFVTHTQPDGLGILKKRADDFIRIQSSKGRSVVLVTSGGSTVPLEVTFPFAIATECADAIRIKLCGLLIISVLEPGGHVLVISKKEASGWFVAEYFIEAGYAVVFLHRKFSLLPYSRHYSHTTNCFLDFMVEGPNGSVEGSPFMTFLIVVDPQYAPSMLPLLRKYKEVSFFIRYSNARRSKTIFYSWSTFWRSTIISSNFVF